VVDGIGRPPSVNSFGIWRGILRLVVVECPPGMRAYGVEIRSEISAAFDEMMYSILGHGDKTGQYDGSVYIKDAIRSQLIET
jgi:hypothetical protein